MNEIQKEVIGKIINEVFPEGNVVTYNKIRRCVTLTSSVNRVRLKDAVKYIDVVYYADIKNPNTTINYVRVFDSANFIEYTFNLKGIILEEIYKTKIFYYRPGRNSDGLWQRSYSSQGILCGEIYINVETQQYHNEKGYAIMIINDDGIPEYQYFINGEFIGANLPVGDDPELYLKNYQML